MSKRILSIIGSILVIIGVYIAVNACIKSLTNLTVSDKETAIEAAQIKVKSYVYKELGIVPEKFSSKVIYENDNQDMLVSVLFATDSYDWLGSYCVYVRNGYVINATKMMGSGYDFQAHLEELKALFAIK